MGPKKRKTVLKMTPGSLLTHELIQRKRNYLISQLSVEKVTEITIHERAGGRMGQDTSNRQGQGKHKDKDKNKDTSKATSMLNYHEAGKDKGDKAPFSLSV